MLLPKVLRIMPQEGARILRRCRQRHQRGQERHGCRQEALIDSTGALAGARRSARPGSSTQKKGTLRPAHRALSSGWHRSQPHRLSPRILSTPSTVQGSLQGPIIRSAFFCLRAPMSHRAGTGGMRFTRKTKHQPCPSSSTMIKNHSRLIYHWR